MGRRGGVKTGREKGTLDCGDKGGLSELWITLDNAGDFKKKGKPWNKRLVLNFFKPV
jgi:hypothetical protein